MILGELFGKIAEVALLVMLLLAIFCVLAIIGLVLIIIGIVVLIKRKKTGKHIVAPVVLLVIGGILLLPLLGTIIYGLVVG